MLGIFMDRVKNNRIETIINSKLKILQIQQIITDKRMKDANRGCRFIPFSKQQIGIKISDIQSCTQKLDYISSYINNRNDYSILNLLVQDRYQHLSLDEIDAELSVD